MQENESNRPINEVYLVHGENTLGYSRNYDPRKAFCSMVVLAVDYLMGGDPTTIDRQVSVNTANARIATEEDFKHFKVRV